MFFIWSYITLQKGNSLKLELGQLFDFVLMGEWRYSSTKSEDHWTNDTFGENGWKIRDYVLRKSKLAYWCVIFSTE